MNADVILMVVGSGGIGAVVVAVVTGLFSKKRLSAEATDLITKAASSVVDNLRADNALVREAAARLNRRVTELERREEVLHRVLDLHTEWDRQAVAALRLHGVDLPAPPPLSVPD